MPAKLYAHLSWTTDARLPMLGASEERFLRAFLPVEAQRHRAEVAALGIVSDHIHVLLRLPSVIDVPKLVQGMKGASARLINKDPDIGPNRIKWARGYDVRSVSPRNLTQAVKYIARQSQRHPERAIPAE